MQLSLRGCALVLALGLAACGGGDGGGEVVTPPPPPPPPPQVVTVRLTAQRTFSPAEVTIAPGTTIRWVNEVEMGHTITPDNATQPGAWQSRSLADAGATTELQFNTAGDFPYHCIPHASTMRGTIRVRAS